MRAVLLVLIATVLSTEALKNVNDMNRMPLSIHAGQKDPSINMPLEDSSDVDSVAMRASSIPDEDAQGEDGVMMSAFSEDGLDAGGKGEAMQLSGPAVPIVTREEVKLDQDEEPVSVSDDMAPGASAIGGVLDAKQQQLADYRQMIEDAKKNLDQQTTDAKRLIQDAYSKQTYLQDLQKQILEQSVSLESQKHALAAREDEIKKLKEELEQKAADLNSQNNLQTAQQTAAQAITAQMALLAQRQKEFEEDSDKKQTQLREMEASLLKLKASVDDRDNSLSRKEEEIKKLYTDLNALSKTSEKHEAKIRAEEAELKKQQDEIAQKQALIDSQLASLHSSSAKKIDELSEVQNALQTELVLDKSLSELPASGIQELGITNDTALVDQIKQQTPVAVHRTAKLVVPQLPSNMSYHEVIDRSTRDVETRLDERPETYGQKLLVGQAYSATYAANPAANHRDADGKCRNSRAEVVPCAHYELADSSNIPPVIPSIGDLLDGDYLVDQQSGPCVLKCGYHRGIGRTLTYVAIEVPTKRVFNQTIACPKTNNGFPFVSCQLLTDDSEQCRTTCLFDGSANPLKPRMLGLGDPSLSKNEFKFNPEDFKSLAHTTYRTVTQSGCAAKTSADPLVSCEVHL